MSDVIESPPFLDGWTYAQDVNGCWRRFRKLSRWERFKRWLTGAARREEEQRIAQARADWPRLMLETLLKADEIAKREASQ